MPIEYTSFDAPALICIRYNGHIIADDLIAAATQFREDMADYASYPHFFDFSRVTGYTINHPKFMSFMALLADIYPADGNEQLFVFYAPPGAPAEMAELARRPWEGNSRILIRVTEEHNHASDILGGAQQELRNHVVSFTS